MSGDLAEAFDVRKVTSRVWLYPRGEWSGRLPSIGGDEHGRRTIVLPLPLGPTLVIAYRNCPCVECDFARATQAAWDRDLRAAHTFCAHRDDDGYPCDPCLDLVWQVAA